MIYLQLNGRNSFSHQYTLYLTYTDKEWLSTHCGLVALYGDRDLVNIC